MVPISQDLLTNSHQRKLDILNRSPILYAFIFNGDPNGTRPYNLYSETMCRAREIELIVDDKEKLSQLLIDPKDILAQNQDIIKDSKSNSLNRENVVRYLFFMGYEIWHEDDINETFNDIYEVVLEEPMFKDLPEFRSPEEIEAIIKKQKHMVESVLIMGGALKGFITELQSEDYISQATKSRDIN